MAKKKREVQQQMTIKFPNTSSKQKEAEEEVESLKERQKHVLTQVANMEMIVDMASEILAIREKTFVETKRLLKEARLALNTAINEYDKAKLMVEDHKLCLENLREEAKEVEAKLNYLLGL